MDLDKIQASIREFAKAREWEQFHTPKNLSMALAGEAAELLEIFQWLTEKECPEVMKNEKTAEAVRHELSDILYYLVRMADVLKVDLEAAFWEKFEHNEKKYPVSLSKGNATKYDKL
jgi:dCTP diphosphatase